MITEHVPITEFRHQSGELAGKFVLSHVAYLNKVSIQVLGSVWHIDDFSPFGDPVLVGEQYYEFLKTEKANYTRFSTFRQRKRLVASVSYEPIIIIAPRSEIDTLSGIRASLIDMYTYLTMLRKRRCWYRETRSSLNEYIVFGRYLLDAHANVWQIQQKISVVPEHFVCKRELFQKIYGGFIATTSFAFPRSASDLCPLCGRPFLIRDLIENEVFQYANSCGPAAHSTCTRKN